MGPINAPALAELSRLLEQPGHHLLPDAVWVSGQAEVFKHLRDVQALSLGPELTDAVLCPDCMSGAIRPEQVAHGSQIGLRAYCGECGWVPLAKERARLWQASPAKVADWLNAALGLRSRHPVTEIVKGVLWHLGEREYKRHRHSLFFGCQLADNQADVDKALEKASAPGMDLTITTSEITVLQSGRLGSRVLVPLRAVAQLRKGSLVIENLEAYIDGIAPLVVSDETSLRLLETKRVALIDGAEVPLSPQVGVAWHSKTFPRDANRCEGNANLEVSRFDRIQDKFCLRSREMRLRQNNFTNPPGGPSGKTRRVFHFWSP